MITAETLMTVGGVSAFILTLGWVRERQLREKYAVIWICVAFGLLILGLFPSLVMYFADSVHLAYPSAVLYIALAAIYLFSFSVSVSISRQYRRNARLTQEVALIEMRLRELERRLADEPNRDPTTASRQERRIRRGIGEPTTMNLTRTQWNLLANLIGQGANAGLAFLFYPAFVQNLGQEAFGVIGFHISLQATITLFDFGISIAANRELARLSAQPNAAATMRSLVASLQLVYWLMASLLGGALYLLAPVLAEHWLQPKELDTADVANALRWMALAIAFQWPTFLYANCISGLQRQGLLNAIQVLASIGRFPGTLVLLLAWTPTLDAYFVGQACVSFAQTAAVMLILWRVLPVADSALPSEPIAWANLRAFATGVGIISVLNLVLSQYDKLLLSTLLPLKEYGYYSQAVALVGGLGIVALPVGTAVFPRFSQLVAANALDELRQIYHHAMQLLAALLLPLSVTLFVYADVTLYVWTGNVTTADQAAGVLRLLTVAMTLYCLLILPNNLQYAHGQTRLLLCIYAVAVVVYVPLGYGLARWAGGMGAAAGLCIVLAAMFTIGVPLVHRVLMPGDVLRWYGDIALPLAPIVALNLALLPIVPGSRVGAAAMLVGTVIGGAVLALAIAPVTRHWLRARFA